MPAITAAITKFFIFFKTFYFNSPLFYNVKNMFRSLLQKTFVVEDYIKYDTNSYNLSPNSAIVQIANAEFVNTGNWQVEWEQNLPSGNCRCILYPYDNVSEFLGIGTPTNNLTRVWETNNHNDYGSYPFNTDYHITFKKQGNTISIFANDNKLKDSTHSAILSASKLKIGVRNWGSGTGTIKNIKIKAL